MKLKTSIGWIECRELWQYSVFADGWAARWDTKAKGVNYAFALDAEEAPSERVGAELLAAHRERACKMLAALLERAGADPSETSAPPVPDCIPVPSWVRGAA